MYRNKSVMNVGLLIFTYNGSKELDRLLNEYHKYFDEIIVVDSYSKDNILEVARKYNVKLYLAPIIGYQDPLFNKGIELFSSNWIATLDLDERFSHAFLRNFKSILKNAEENGFNGIALPFIEVAKGKFFSMEFIKIKIFRKGYVYFSGNVHCKPILNGKFLRLSYPYIVIHDFVKDGWIKLFKKNIKYIYLAKFSSIYRVDKIPLLPKIFHLKNISNKIVPRSVLILLWFINPYLSLIRYIRGYRRKYSLLSIFYHIILSTLYYYPYIFRSSNTLRIAKIVHEKGISNILIKNLYIKEFPLKT